MACLLGSDDAARTVSLTENVQREAMHPADQFEAFAADFGVKPLVVQRRLKLPNVAHPPG